MDIFKKGLPYIIVLSLFYIISYLFTPQVLRNEVVNQADIASWRGMANEIITYNESNPDGERALWTNSMFSGMPATSIGVIYKGDYTDYLYRAIHKVFGVRPPSYFMISLVGGFLLFLAFGVNFWLAAIGAFAITFCSYNMQIIQVGHNSKMVAIAFMPWVLAALVYTYRSGKALFGSLLFALALSFQIKANHPQITYYLAIIVIGYGFAQLAKAVKEKLLPKFFKTSLLLLLIGLLGIATNINHLWPTYEYSKYTMRGGSELAKEEGKAQEGLDIDYATAWSYSPMESLNLMIPNLNGGASSGELTTKSETYKALRSGGYQGAHQVIKQLPLYWGPQPFTAGPSYLGAISVFLFILSLLLLRGAERWWLALVSLLAILLSWGSNFLPLTKLFFNWAPLYNKFRTVSMILVVLQITVPIGAILALQRVLFENKKVPSEEKRVGRALKISLILTAGVALLFLLLPSLAGDFVSQADGGLPQVIKESLIKDRISLLRVDALRSLLLIVATAAALWLAYFKKVQSRYVLLAIASLFFVDLWFVGDRYLNGDHFVKERDFKNQYQKRVVDDIILEDNDLSYRVIDLSVNTFNDSHISYHHKNIGGYSPAKLQLYQDLIERHIAGEIGSIAADIEGAEHIEEAEAMLGYYPALNMLNCRYIILGANLPPMVNSKAFGNSWFANQFIEVDSLNEEISLLGEIGERGERAVVNTAFLKEVEGASQLPIEEGELIELTHYSPNRLTYRSTSDKERVALFSEVYYPAGWSATIDGEKVEIFRANWLLRGVRIPKGEHTIQFTFKPHSIVKGARLSAIASTTLLLLLLLVIGTYFTNFRNSRERKIADET